MFRGKVFNAGTTIPTAAGIFFFQVAAPHHTKSSNNEVGSGAEKSRHARDFFFLSSFSFSFKRDFIPPVVETLGYSLTYTSLLLQQRISVPLCGFTAFLAAAYMSQSLAAGIATVLLMTSRLPSRSAIAPFDFFNENSSCPDNR